MHVFQCGALSVKIAMQKIYRVLSYADTTPARSVFRIAS
jgi:hypothetical protein